MLPNILTIAGSDPSGGAGIQADIKAISANGGYACAVVTALTAQNTRTVSAVHTPPVEFLQQQLETLFDDVWVDAVKIGMLGDAGIIRTVAGMLREHKPPNIVLDPVMIAKSGAALLEDEAVGALVAELLPQAALITPNLPEAARLLNRPDTADTAEAFPEIAAALLQQGASAVYLKGGHLPGEQSPDYLLAGDTKLWLPGERIETANTHGSGCTLSATLATYLGRGHTLEKAAHSAKAYVQQAIAQSGQLQVGRGHGPLHHFYGGGVLKGAV